MSKHAAQVRKAPPARPLATRRPPRRPLLGLAAAWLVATAPRPAPAAGPEAYVDALTRALAPAEVVAGGTVFGEPLVTAGNAVEPLLPRTPEVVARLCALISTAEKEVLLQTYQWQDGDEAAEAVLEALRSRVGRTLAGEGGPLRVRVLTSKTWPSEDQLAQAHLRAFVRHVGEQAGASGRVELDWATYRGSPLAIQHVKTVVVDGAQALVMTGNLYTHGGLAQDSVNVASLLRGPVVAGLRADWHNARAQASTEEATGALAPLALPTPVPAGEATAAILSRPSNWTYWSAGERNPQAQGLLALVRTATSAIDVVNPAVGVPALQQALVDAIVERGVRVRAVVSLQMNRQREHLFFGGDNVDHAYTLYRALLQQGGEAAADRLRIAFGALDGHEASPAESPGNVHAKVASFDGACLLVGSTNWNWLSWNNGRELSVAIVAPDEARAFSQDTFARLLRLAAPLREQDLRPSQRRAGDPVAAYLRARGGA